MDARRDDATMAGDDHRTVTGQSPHPTILWSLASDARSDARNHGAADAVVSRNGIEQRLLPTLSAVTREAAEYLLQGNLVAFPTETVYGLGGLAQDDAAVRRIFAAKGRPADNPLIAHVSSLEQVERLCVMTSPLAQRLMEAFWPGPLSILLPARAHLPAALTAGLPMVAVRMPRHPLALALIEAVGQPLAAPSANVSGRPSPTTAEHVLEDFASSGAIAGVIDGGPCEVGIESTVVAVETDGRLVILRPGHITREDLAAFCDDVLLDPHLLSVSEHEQPRAPGQKYRHYAPRGDVSLIECSDRDRLHAFMAEQALRARQTGERVALLPLTPAPSLDAASADLWYPLGSWQQPDEIARHLYAALRACDEQDCTRVIMECPPDTKPYRALRNRMLKAANSSVRTLP